jgi:hypothetical protein
MKLLHTIGLFIISLFLVTSVQSQEIVDIYSNIQSCDVTAEGDVRDCTLSVDLHSSDKVIQTKKLQLEGPGTWLVIWDDFETEDGPFNACAKLIKGENVLSENCYDFYYGGRVPIRFDVRDFRADSKGIDLLIYSRDPTVVDIDYMLIEGNKALYVSKEESIPILANQMSWEWKQILENDKEYSGRVKIFEPRTKLTRSFMNTFIAEDNARITDTYEDETGASATVLGESRVPFEGEVRFSLSQDGESIASVMKKTPILLAGDDETIEISWNGTLAPGVYELKTQLIGNDGDIIDVEESIIEAKIPPRPPVVEEPEENPGFSTIAAMLSLISLILISKRRRKKD